VQPKQKTKNLIEEVTKRYAFAVTDEVMETINPDDPNDPVARQYLPSLEELKMTPEENADPIGDDAHSPVKGIVHRYPDRVLLKPIHVCPVYCRFCFRREMVGPGSEMLSADELKAAIAYIRNTKEVREVILTGGDPFILSPRRLKDLMDELNNIDHVKIIRFHTRVPVANPSRVTEELVAALESKKSVIVVVHCNHAQELTVKVRAATQLLLKAGIPLLSQSVLLKGVNNNAETLEKLFRALAEMRIKPYYLHHPDLAPGTSHFRLSLKEGQQLMQSLQGNLSGIALPRYMLDIPGGFGKVPVEAPWVEEKDGGYIVTDRHGEKHLYPPEAKPKAALVHASDGIF
jgi:lysine 2,3-aminomutase